MLLIDSVNTQCVGLFGNALTNLSSFDILETIKSEANQISCNPTIFEKICMLGPSMLLLQKLNMAAVYGPRELTSFAAKIFSLPCVTDGRAVS